MSHHRRRILSLIWPLLLACAAGAGSAEARTIIVSPRGSDGNQGTINSPVATPQRAINMAERGDTIYLKAGTYTVNQALRDWKENLTFASYPNEQATIITTKEEAVWVYRANGVMIQGIKFAGPIDLESCGKVILITEANDVTLADLDVSGGWDYAVKWDAYDGDSKKPPAWSFGGRILRCYIHHTGRDAVKTFNADNLLIEDSEIAFTGLREDNAEGIDSIGSKGITIRRCYIHDTRTTGVYLKGGASNGLIEQCRIVNCGNSGLLFGQDTDEQFMRDRTPYEAIDCVARNNVIVNTEGAGIGTYSGNNIRFENNTLYGVAKTYHAGFYVVMNGRKVPSRQVAFKNNIVVMGSTDRPMAYVIYLADKLVCDSNIWFRSEGGPYKFNSELAGATNYFKSFGEWRRVMGVDQHSLAVDPQLDPASLYKPLAASPALERGEKLADVPADYSGVARPQGNAYDIGAHEFAGKIPAGAGGPIAGSAGEDSSAAGDEGDQGREESRSFRLVIAAIAGAAGGGVLLAAAVFARSIWTRGLSEQRAER